MKLEIGSALDVGIKRKGKANQDALVIIDTENNKKRSPLMIVADGMGGYEGGSIASKIVIDSMAAWYRDHPDDTDVKSLLKQAVQKAHKGIIQAAEEDPRLSHMGSTVVAALIDGEYVYITNVGDSHAYLINSAEVKQINWDHSLVADELRKGNISEEDVRFFPHKNVLTMSISAQRMDIEPYVARYGFNFDDILLLCSDGLWGPVDRREIQKIVLTEPPQRAAEKLVDLANANDGPDNISVIIARDMDYSINTQETMKL